MTAHGHSFLRLVVAGGGAALAGTARPPAGKEPKVRVGFGRAGAALSSRLFDVLPPSLSSHMPAAAPTPPSS